MANKNIEGYALHCPTALKKKYKKLSGMKDFIGFLVFRHYGYENYRNANNGWFFVSTADFIKENVVGSKTTLHKYETKLRQDGLIEKKTGDFSERKANEYRLLFNPSTGEIMTDLSVQFSEKSVPMENPLETALRNVKGCTDKCTDDIADNEEVNEKSVPMIFPKKCTTDTDTLTDIDNNINVSLNKAIVKEQSLENTVDEEKEHSNNVNMEKVQLPGYSHFFTDGFEDGWCIKLIEAVRDADNEREVLWQKWKGFCNYLKTEPDISFTKAEQYVKTFRYLIGRIYKEQRANELKRNVTHDFNSLFKHFFLVQWKRFLSNVSELAPADRKKTRLEFYSKLEKVFEGEEYTKTLSMMEEEGYEAYSKAGLLNFKPEELDPDLKYQNLAEQEQHVTVKEGDELPFSTNCEFFEGEVHETVSGSFEKVRRAWKKLIAECYQNKQQMSTETMGVVINKLESMGGTVSEIEELKKMMDDDVEALNRKIS